MCLVVGRHYVSIHLDMIIELLIIILIDSTALQEGTRGASVTMGWSSGRDNVS